MTRGLGSADSLPGAWRWRRTAKRLEAAALRQATSFSHEDQQLLVSHFERSVSVNLLKPCQNWAKCRMFSVIFSLYGFSFFAWGTPKSSLTTIYSNKPWLLWWGAPVFVAPARYPTWAWSPGCLERLRAKRSRRTHRFGRRQLGVGNGGSP